MTFSDISIRQACSGLKQLRCPAVLARPLSCVVVRKHMPEKEVLKEKLPFFKLFCGVLGESDPTGQLCGNVPPLEKPLCTLTTAQRGSGLPRHSQKTWPTKIAGNLYWHHFDSNNDFGPNWFCQSSGSPANAIGEGLYSEMACLVAE